MKKPVFVLIVLLTLIFSAKNVLAQSEDYFVGKWKITVTGVPDGTATSIYTFVRGEDGKLTGNTAHDGNEPITFAEVEEDGDEVVAYYTSTSGYEVYLMLEKVDENHAEGSLLDMFDATGERIIEEK